MPDLGRRADAGHDRHAASQAKSTTARIEAGRHDEAGAGRQRGLGLGHVQDRPCAHQDLGNGVGDRRDRRRRRGRAEGDLGAGQPGVNQGPSQRNGVFDPGDLDDGDDFEVGDERLEIEVGFGRPGGAVRTLWSNALYDHRNLPMTGFPGKSSIARSEKQTVSVMLSNKLRSLRPPTRRHAARATPFAVPNPACPCSVREMITYGECRRSTN